MISYSISFVGAGRVGSALCTELSRAGHRIITIVSETALKGNELAASCGAVWSSKPEFAGDTEIIIVAVPDHRLEIVLNNIDCQPGTLVVHTAGSIGLEVFPEKIVRKGIFYPLQTFSHGRKVEFEGLPFFLEAIDDDASGILKNLAESVGGKVFFADARSRSLLHLAAVFACNFTNHLLTGGKELAHRAGFSFDELVPLVRETVSKAIDLGPEKSQTGPAVRNDSNTIERHMALLEGDRGMRAIYREMTNSIMKYYKISNSGQF